MLSPEDESWPDEVLELEPDVEDDPEDAEDPLCPALVSGCPLPDCDPFADDPCEEEPDEDSDWPLFCASVPFAFAEPSAVAAFCCLPASAPCSLPAFASCELETTCSIVAGFAPKPCPCVVSSTNPAVTATATSAETTDTTITLRWTRLSCARFSRTCWAVTSWASDASPRCGVDVARWAECSARTRAAAGREGKPS